MAGPSSGDPVIGFDLATDLPGFMAALKQVDPKLAASIRKGMRGSGAGAIKNMGALLDAYQGGVVSGKTYKRGKDSRGRTRRLVDTRTISAAARPYSRRTRVTTSTRKRTVDGVTTSKTTTKTSKVDATNDVKAGLKFRVTASKTRTTVRLTTTKGDLRKALNAKAWRHPAFQSDQWVEQPGNGYFTRGAFAELANTKAALEDAIRDGLSALEGRTFTPH